MPALLFTLAMVIFPTLFGHYFAFTDWNLNGASRHHFNGLDNLITLWNDAYFWNALGDMIFYVSSVLAQYAIAFGLALLLNADIRGRKFFRVAFLLPFMLSPVAVSWMIGKSIMENRFGP
ncbi:carbohydrate ABC transporter permease, partial [Bradyrhizobium sp.]|uniref:carbohydrate ABC transporter permease n=1 Tax=Bradyrhizobium sp. TaxID=376 RepID=UPI003F8D7E90|nr:sugar ABC transporter permease [Bradyrhizobium sp.]